VRRYLGGKKQDRWEKHALGAQIYKAGIIITPNSPATSIFKPKLF
jgi:hypothetical protein